MDPVANTKINTEDGRPQPQWKPLTREQRRVLGVLVEKAKTTPDQYPLSLNGVKTGANQKSNRSPQMELDLEDLEDILDALREMSVVGEVQGGGRVAKYRHYVKDWMGVDGTELAVMAELLLRGEQTVGELRGRAARMAAGQLPDMSSLKPVLQSLIAQELVVELTPAGRGQVVTHNLYQDHEMEKLRGQYAGGAPAVARPAPASRASSSPASAPAASKSPSASSGADGSLRAEVAELRAEVARMKKEIEDIWSSIS